MTPLEKGKAFVCNIKKVYSGKLEKLFPKYYVYINNNDKLLMVAKKIFQATSSVYHICISDSNFANDSDAYLGKVSSNLIGNEFSIFDKGKKYSEAKTENELRIQFGCVNYNINLFRKNGPRKMKVYLPALDSSNSITVFKPRSVTYNIIFFNFILQDKRIYSKCLREKSKRKI
jgi:tubby-related protein 1